MRRLRIALGRAVRTAFAGTNGIVTAEVLAFVPAAR